MNVNKRNFIDFKVTVNTPAGAFNCFVQDIKHGLGAKVTTYFNGNKETVMLSPCSELPEGSTLYQKVLKYVHNKLKERWSGPLPVGYTPG